MPTIPQPDADGIRRIQKDRKAEAQERNEWLRENETPPEFLIFPLGCLVTDVYGSTKKIILHGTDLEVYPKKKTGDYFTGQESYLELAVEPAVDCKVKELVFPGCWPIEAGDSIIAYILRGEIETENEESWPFTLPKKPHYWGREINTFEHLVPRDWLETEKPIYIEKIREDKVMATYRDKSRKDIHFKPFVQPEEP